MDARAGSAHVKAAVYDRYGPPEVLRIEEVERPVPGDDEVLVKIHATTVNRTDTGFRSAEYFLSRFYTGLRRPRRGILGSEFAGEIEAIGPRVREFAVGDRVFGVNVPNYGTHAEFVAVRESAPIAPMPKGMTFEQAAAVCDGAMLAIGLLGPSTINSASAIACSTPGAGWARSSPSWWTRWTAGEASSRTRNSS
jgi:NADPH:quinone reductase-like Zn-dependent oxidoreductase